MKNVAIALGITGAVVIIGLLVCENSRRQDRIQKLTAPKIIRGFA
jgi:hypothetical protein